MTFSIAPFAGFTEILRLQLIPEFRSSFQYFKFMYKIRVYIVCPCINIKFIFVRTAFYQDQSCQRGDKSVLHLVFILCLTGFSVVPDAHVYVVLVIDDFQYLDEAAREIMFLLRFLTDYSAVFDDIIPIRNLHFSRTAFLVLLARDSVQRQYLVFQFVEVDKQFLVARSERPVLGGGHDALMILVYDVSDAVLAFLLPRVCTHTEFLLAPVVFERRHRKIAVLDVKHDLRIRLDLRILEVFPEFLYCHIVLRSV